MSCRDVMWISRPGRKDGERVCSCSFWMDGVEWDEVWLGEGEGRRGSFFFLFLSFFSFSGEVKIIRKQKGGGSNSNSDVACRTLYSKKTTTLHHRGCVRITSLHKTGRAVPSM